MRRWKMILGGLGLLVPQVAEAQFDSASQWTLVEEYIDKEPSEASVSINSQDMPIGLRDSLSASLSVTCLPSVDRLYVSIIWPERMTYGKSIRVIRTLEGFPTAPEEWEAGSGAGDYQSITLNAGSLAGTELMNRLLTSTAPKIAFKPLGSGREQDAVFSLVGLKEKLQQVTKACPKWSYFDKTKK